MDAAHTVGRLVGDPSLGYGTLNCVIDEFFVPVLAGSSPVQLWDDISPLIVGIGIDPRKCADPTTRGPGSRALAIRRRNAFSAFYERKYFGTGHQYRVESLHRTFSPSSPPFGATRTPPEVVSRSCHVAIYGHLTKHITQIRQEPNALDKRARRVSSPPPADPEAVPHRFPGPQPASTNGPCRGHRYRAL